MDIRKTSHELEASLGEQVQQLRLLKNIDQRTFAEQAGISTNALKHLEGGKGARVHTLVRVLRALNKGDWIETLAPAVSIDPLQMLKPSQRERKRAHRRTVHV